MEKSKRTGRYKSSRTRLQFCRLENSAKNTDILMSGPAVKSHIWPNKGRKFSARRKIWCLLLSRDCRQAPSCCTSFPQDLSNVFQVQQVYEVRKKRRETDAKIPKPKHTKKNTTNEQRETACETSQSGQIISDSLEIQNSHNGGNGQWWCVN